MSDFNLIQRVTERSFIARRDSYPTQGVVVSVDTMKNVCTIDTGHTLTDGSKEYLRDIPFQPHAPPKIGWTATVAYASNTPQSAYVAMTQLGSSTPQTSLQAVGYVGGDLSGKLPDPKVSGIQGTPVSTTTPLDGQVLLFVGADAQWEPATVGGVSASDLNQLTWKHTVHAATTMLLPDYVYDNGVLGVGATLTASANGALPAQDGVTLAVDDRLLVKDEINSSTHFPATNGLYTVTSIGGGSAKWVLTRTADYDQPSKMGAGTAVFVELGATNEHIAFVQTAWPVLVGTTAIEFVRFTFNGAVDNGVLATMPPFTLKGNNTALTAAPADLTAPIVSGEMAARNFRPTGLTGATAASRYVGGTASGAPVSGTFLLGDFVIDQSGAVWICQVGGSPGTWIRSAGGLIYAPLSNGDPSAPELIWDASGEVILVPVTL